MDQSPAITTEEADLLVLEHQGWAESIARSVARSWNMDWRSDGLDGAAMEALIFCARRFQPGRGVPFRGYARRRIHEASTDQARRSRGWKKGLGSGQSTEDRSREVASELLNVFPELRVGELPGSDDGDGDVRSAIRQILVGATLIAGREAVTSTSPDDLLDFKRLVAVMATLEVVHQELLWRVYWEGLSLRTVAAEWGTDGLNVIREHKILLAHLQKCMSLGRQSLARPRVRPGLRETAAALKKTGTIGAFSKLLGGSGGA